MSKIAIFAAGCFWGVEKTFRALKGVVDTRVGYTGGHTENPSYEDVCSDTTGHAEAIRVEFDPKTVSYSQLLDVFWHCHDPTQKDRQGPDVGSQYRSAIFYQDDNQREEAERSRDEYQKTLGKPIQTEITKARTFYEAEEYHQRYLEKKD